MGYAANASGDYSTALGSSLFATAYSSMELGHWASAAYPGSLVWGDKHDVLVTSPGSNQFVIRASGGVGVNTNNPNGAALSVNGKLATSGDLVGPMWSVIAVTDTNFGPTANIKGGHSGNIISNGLAGGFIGGGGQPDSPNVVGNNYASVLGGFGNTASGDASTAAGALTLASGFRSTAMGYLTTASADYTTAMGAQTIASGAYSTAAGRSTTASGVGATAVGRSTIASGLGSTAMGFQASAIGNSSVAMGYDTSASDDFSAAMGDRTIASGNYATAMGFRSVAAGITSMALGANAMATNNNTFVWSDGSVGIFASTDANQFLISAGGGVGIGTAAPQASLHVASSATFPKAQLLLTQTANDYARLQMGVGTNPKWMFAVQPAATPSLEFYLGETKLAELTSAGAMFAQSFNPTSDRNAKENFDSVSPQEVLEKVAGLKITRWNFIGDGKSPHVGPMAQDFHTAFGLGPTINTSPPSMPTASPLPPSRA